MGLLSAITIPVDGLRQQQGSVAAHVERENFGNGTLYIAESQVSWVNSGGQGFTIPYPAISLHAVSKDLTAYPHECLYLMIDASIMPEVLEVPRCQDTGGSGDNNEEEETEEEDDTIREIRFIPEDKQTLEQLFTVMSDCQILHPDPDDSEPSDGDYGDEFDDAEDDMGEIAEVEEGSGVSQVTDRNAQGSQVVATQNGHTDSSKIRTEGISGQDEPMDTGQFADAEMEPDH
ncbi:methylosome subunit pICln-like [Asterias amurensis]|uniref:methylosome subunit pICln-like n=1 Tax=Asterias amurensis TaxID=7602 RepID=UPI003AB80BF9